MPHDHTLGQTRFSRAEVAVAIGIVLVLVSLLILAVSRAREQARRTQSRYNLKQLGLALHNYHDTYRVFPPGGVFNTDAVAFHEWTTMITPYLDASPWYNFVDFRIPWDDPQQVDLFRDANHDQARYWINPSRPDPIRTDGLISNHYAGCQTIFFRNSSVSLHRLSVSSERLLVADAYDQLLPVGAPFGWRDITLGLGDDLNGFGSRGRDVTQCLMADGVVRELSGAVTPDVLESMAGPVADRPAGADVQRIESYPPLDLSRIWKLHFAVDGEEGDPDDKSKMVFRKTPPADQTGLQQP